MNNKDKLDYQGLSSAENVGIRIAGRPGRYTERRCVMVLMRRKMKNFSTVIC